MNFRIITLLCSIPLFLSSCVRHVFRSSEFVPEIEVQINQTPEQIDDYVANGAYKQCQARIINNRNGNANTFPSGVAVHLKNYRTAGGQVNFLTSAVGAGTTTLNITLPANGDWGTFWIRGTTNSAIDKDAVIEVAENRAVAEDVVLARKALMVTGTPPASPTAKVEIRVGALSTIDDYLTWSPTPCYIHIANPDDIASNVNVTIQNLAGTGNKLRFATEGTFTSFASTATASTIPLTLPEDGTWIAFYVAGFFDPAATVSSTRGSTVDKDAVMEAVQGGTVLGREGVMVRIRKNANTLSTEERDRFLNALQKLNLTYNRYRDFYDMHRTTTVEDRFEMHSSSDGTAAGPLPFPPQANSAFLPWHRAQCLHLERFLQSIDPSVAIPYWKYDEPAPNIFSPNFLGATNAVLSATLDPSNPLSGWIGPDVITAGIQRRTRYNSLTQSPATPGVPGGGNPSTVDATTLASGTDFAAINNDAVLPFELGSHGPAHLKSGQGNSSWISNLDLAVRDPLFFLLHANVDRIWAKWQWTNDHFDPASTSAYTPAGAFTSGPDDVAEYADETMWPWNGKTGPGTIASVLNVRPPAAPGGSFPQSVGYLLSPLTVPTVKSFVDIRSDRLSTTTNRGFGFAYDDQNPFAP